VFGIIKLGAKLIERLKRPGYRAGYVAEHVRRGIAYQIRALRDQRQWNQGTFSKQLGKPQSVVSRLEDPSYGKVTLQTLLEVAKTFDVALQVRFVPFSEFLLQTRDVTSASMKVDSFSDELKKSFRPVVIRHFDVVRTSGELPQFDWNSGALLDRPITHSDAKAFPRMTLQ
jgi:hypothetical protein